MGLVDYSESESSASEAEAPAKKAPKPQNSSKKPFQKFGDRSNPNKVVVNLPQPSAASSSATHSDEPPSKRARTGGGGLFAGLNSFLPAPKNANKPASTPSASHTRPGIHLKTSAAPGFSRDDDEEGGLYGRTAEESTGSTTLPAPKKAAEPSIPEGQTPADDVKLVGKPLMFKPLSVARKPNKKKGAKSMAAATAATAAPANTTSPVASSSKLSDQLNGSNITRDPAPVAAPKKVSLFSMHTEEPAESAQKGGAYEPLFTGDDYLKDATDEYAQYAASVQPGPAVSTSAGAESLDRIADDMNLSATARRELFGRDGGQHGAKRVINFNMDREYAHNEEIRAAGEQQIHNPVRGLQGGGKHSLQKLVQNVRGQQDALEDSFAKGKNNRKEAASRYGW